MVDPFESYKLYNALKLHFETDYDAIKYNFKSNVSPNSFFKRRDKYFFAKIARNNKDLLNYYVFNFIEDVKYVADMDDKHYTKHKKIHDALTRTFQTDIDNISDEKFDILLSAGNNNQAPKIIEKWMHEEITLETLVIVNALTNFVNLEGKKITETIFWPDVSRKITKYTPFVKFDRDKYMNIIKKAFTIA
tara:strand:- start:520 stop:1092 length:573 start_codon:yes stop_codon:yes gene_type:complete